MGFRLEITDSRGNIVDEVSVELRGENIPGRVLRDGDTVIVKGRRSKRGLVDPKGVYVVPTHAEIKVKRHGCLATILALPLGLAFLLAWPAIVVGILNFEQMGWLVPVSLIVMAIYYFIYIR